MKHGYLFTLLLASSSVFAQSKIEFSSPPPAKATSKPQKIEVINQDSDLERQIKSLQEHVKAQDDQIKSYQQKAANAPSSGITVEEIPQTTASKSSKGKSCPVVNCNNSSNDAALKKQIASMKTSLAAKDREIQYLKTSLASAQSGSSAQATETPPVEAAPPTEAVVSSVAYRNWVTLYGGMGPTTYEQTTEDDGSISVQQKTGAVFGVGYTYKATESWSFSGTGLSNKTVLGGVGYGF